MQYEQYRHMPDISIHLHSSLHGHTGSVDHIVLSGKTLVSAGADWSVTTYRLTHFYSTCTLIHVG